MKYKNTGYNLKPYIVEIIIDRIETLKLNLYKDFDLELNNLIRLPSNDNSVYHPIDTLEYFIKVDNQTISQHYTSVTQHFIEYFAHHLKLKASDILAMAEVSRKLDGYIDIEHYYKVYIPIQLENNLSDLTKKFKK